MARLARVAVAGVAYHVTQRGNGRQFLLASDAEREVYMELLRAAVRSEGVGVMGYCLMSNHVHLVVMPERIDSLARALQSTHGRYASYWNAAHRSCGHAWQGRFYSCPLDEGHLWRALRYTERNPVRAGLAAEPAGWAWSSAGAHCGVAEPDVCLEMTPWRARWNEESWRAFLAEEESESALRELRRCTKTGRPLGSGSFIDGLEESIERRLRPRKGGRPRKAAVDPRQKTLTFVPLRRSQPPPAREQM